MLLESEARRAEAVGSDRSVRVRWGQPLRLLAEGSELKSSQMGIWEHCLGKGIIFVNRLRKIIIRTRLVFC